MIKQCQRCGADFEAKTAAKYCEACRPIVHREQQYASAKRLHALNPDKRRDYDRLYYAEHSEKICERKKKYYEANWEQIIAKQRKRRKLERQKAKLREKLKAIHAKRQAELERQQKYYQDPPSMFDGVGVPVQSSLALLGMEVMTC